MTVLKRKIKPHLRNKNPWKNDGLTVRLDSSCGPKDVKALIHAGQKAGVSLGVLQAVEAANERQKRVLVDKVISRFGPDLTGKHFAIWGLAFKPNTDDMREAPSRVVVAQLLQRGATLSAYDPEGGPGVRS